MRRNWLIKRGHTVRAVGDHPGELAPVLGVELVETLDDELRVLLVAREHDRLPETLTALDAVPISHHGLEHLVDGVLVEQEPVHLVGRDLGRGRVVFVPVELVPALLLLVGELVVAQATLRDSQRDVNGERADQITVGLGLV